jgi:serine/threonine protein kinase
MDRYKVLKRIGVGTYGSAYLVCLKHNPAYEFVLKKIKLDQASDKERQQAEQEVRLLAQLDHPLVLGYAFHTACCHARRVLMVHELANSSAVSSLCCCLEVASPGRSLAPIHHQVSLSTFTCTSQHPQVYPAWWPCVVTVIEHNLLSNRPQLCMCARGH